MKVLCYNNGIRGGGGIVDERERRETDDPGLLARRLLRLEERMDRFEAGTSAPLVHPAWPLALGCTSAVLGYLGMGVPRHPYQYLFGGLLVLLFYHRGFLVLANGRWQWPLAAVNAANILLFFVIVLGGGMRYPFLWLKMPAVVPHTEQQGGSWYTKLVPDYDLQWHMVPGVSDWSVDLTKVQVFLLIATLAGALFRFQGFASIAALALLVVSIPAYLAFSWDWVVLFLVIGSVSLYLQTAPPVRSSTLR
jgi:hypothetical protein